MLKIGWSEWVTKELSIYVLRELETTFIVKLLASSDIVTMYGLPSWCKNGTDPDRYVSSLSMENYLINKNCHRFFAEVILRLAKFSQLCKTRENSNLLDKDD
jgi:hypothetical protein